MNDFVALVGPSPSDNFYWETDRVDDDWRLKKQGKRGHIFYENKILNAPINDNNVLFEKSDVLVRSLGLIVFALFLTVSMIELIGGRLILVVPLLSASFIAIFVSGQIGTRYEQ
jgi:hypothetical protein